MSALHRLWNWTLLLGSLTFWIALLWTGIGMVTSGERWQVILGTGGLLGLGALTGELLWEVVRKVRGTR